MHRSPALPGRARRRSLSAAVWTVSVTGGVVVAACTFAAPAAVAAAAATPAEAAAGPIEVTPRHAEAGTQIELRTDLCGGEPTAFATSVAFETDVDLQRTGDGAAFQGYAMISAEAEAGTYGLTVVCGEDAERGEGSFKVVRASGSGTEDGSGTESGGGYDGGYGESGQGETVYGEDGYGDGAGHDPYEPGDPYASPVAPVRAGGGGTAGDPAGGTTADAQRIGLTLAGGAAVAGAVAWAVRRRRADAHPGG
jgi:hypothetical protein